MSIHLWIARHAPVREQGRCYGRFDIEVDRSPAAAAERLLENVPFPQPQTLFTSPSRRCREVAVELARHWGAEVLVDERLAELSMGRFEGKTWSEIEATDADAYAAWMDHWRTEAPPGGESPFDLEKRIRSFLAHLEPNGVYVLMTHAGVWRALDVTVHGVTWDDAMAKPVPHLSWLSMDVASR